ncbi:hypothetical protein LCGC14_1578010 [marine sediment metagenome]|uniref:HNH nuclease domain-containing protein n=1 Tax=marine sediment metagenome TaxID=412755 RepID=A0A0F9IHQ3_9ZZZZ
MKKTLLRQVSSKQKIELALRRKLKQELLEECPGVNGYKVCPRCLKRPDFRGLQLAHKIPLSRGGKTDRTNCEILCATCHFVDEHHQKEVQSEPKWST